MYVLEYVFALYINGAGNNINKLARNKENKH